MIFNHFIKATKTYLAQSEGLGFLQGYNLLKALSIVVVSIFLAHFIKNPEIINQWETLMLLGTTFTFFYVSGLGYTLVSFIKQYPKSDWPTIYLSTYKLLLTFSLGSIFLIIISGYYFKSIRLPIFHILLFCIYLLGNTIGTLVENMFFLEKNFKKLWTWGLLNFLLFIIAIALPLLFNTHLLYSLIFLAILGCLKFLYTLSILNFNINLGAKSYLKALLNFNWPIILSLIFGTGYIYVSSFILKNLVSDIDFNLFRYGSRDFPIFLILANSLSVVIGGSTSENYLETNYWAQIKKSQLRLLHQVFPLACCIMLSSKYLFISFFSVDFGQAYIVFNILLLTVMARVLFPQSILMGLNKTKPAFYTSIIESIIGISLVIILTPLFGIRGAAIGMALAYFFEKIILIGICYYYKIEFHKSINILAYFGYTLILLLCFILSLSI